MNRAAIEHPAPRLWATTFEEARRLAPAAPYLVSFPRTGSHWLRLFLETYFDRPLLTRSFLPHAGEEFLLIHTHDLAGEADDARDVLYLHRDAVDTVYSELTYRMGAAAAEAPREAVAEVAGQYQKHLDRWLGGAAPRRRFLAVQYEALQERADGTLASVIGFLGGRSDPGRIATVWPTITRERVAERTTHDPRVIDRDSGNGERRARFRAAHGGRIADIMRGVPGEAHRAAGLAAS